MLATAKSVSTYILTRSQQAGKGYLVNCRAYFITYSRTQNGPRGQYIATFFDFLQSPKRSKGFNSHPFRFSALGCSSCQLQEKEPFCDVVIVNICTEIPLARAELLELVAESSERKQAG